MESVPPKSEVIACSKEKLINWAPMVLFVKFSEQSKASHMEQKFPLEVTVRSMAEYSQSFGPALLTFKKG